MAKKKNDVEIVYLAPNKLTDYAKNAKKHPDEQIDKLAQQIDAFGFDQPIVVDKKLVIIKGHGRKRAALKLGLSRVPVIISDLSESEAKAARIADNKVTSLEYDENLLKFDLHSLSQEEFDLRLTGMDGKELKGLVDSVTPEFIKNIEDFDYHPEVDPDGEEETHAYTLVFDSAEDLKAFSAALAEIKKDDKSEKSLATKVLNFIQEAL